MEPRGTTKPYKLWAAHLLRLVREKFADDKDLLAARTGLSYRVISYYLAGEKYPKRADSRKRLADAFGVSLDELEGPRGKPPASTSTAESLAAYDFSGRYTYYIFASKETRKIATGPLIITKSAGRDFAVEMRSADFHYQGDGFASGQSFFATVECEQRDTRERVSLVMRIPLAEKDRSRLGGFFCAFDYDRKPFAGKVAWVLQNKAVQPRYVTPASCPRGIVRYLKDHHTGLVL